MAKMTIAGNALVISSSMKLKDLKTIKKYRPRALILTGGEDNKTALYAIGVSDDGSGSINPIGACFAQESHDGEEKACITVNLDGVQGNVREFIADKYGEAFTNLNILEATLPAVLDEIVSQKAAIMENISVVQ